MGIYILIAALTVVAFIAMVLMLAIKPRFAGKVTCAFLVVAAVGNLLFYSYGYAFVCPNIPLAIIRTLLSVCTTFVGGNNFSNISSAPLMQLAWVQTVFWFLHWCSVYATASAAVATVGVEVLKKLRLWLARGGQLNIIFDVNADTVEFGKQLLAQKRGAVVYVARQPTADAVTAITRAGCVIRSDKHALDADTKFLKSIGWGNKKRNICLYALSKDSSANIRYARALLGTLQAFETQPEYSRLVILGQEEIAVSQLQICQDRYGYGFVSAVNGAQLAARLLNLQYPPCNTLSFDANGKACEDFEALIIGFGQVGQAVLKMLVMNGQFEGSTFHAAVFAPDCHSVSGRYQALCKEIFNRYDITMHPYDARSSQLYTYLEQKGSRLKYVAICTGSDKLNREIVEELTEFFRYKGTSVPVYQCSQRGVVAYAADGTVSCTQALYHTDLLCHDALDRMAMAVNHRYHMPTQKTAQESWMDCDYFSRQSCRAAADFTGAVLRAAGMTAQQVMEDGWELTAGQLENLSKTEHLRWCAFHYCMGFTAMKDEEFDARAREFTRQKESGIPTVRIAKNMTGRTHACLVEWDALDGLSDKENRITGKNVDYKKADEENVLVVPELLRASQQQQRE